MNAKRSIYEFDNYRDFLKNFCQEAKSQDKKYSFRYFSKAAGFVAPNHIQRIIEGDRNLSVAGMEKLAKALKLNTQETFFFKSLVFFNQASSHEDRQAFAEELLRSRAYRKRRPLTQLQFNYYSNWYYVPIRELVSLPDFQEDPQWIAQAMRPHITPEEAAKALVELTSLGLLIRSPEGKLVQANANITSPDLISNSFYVRFHKDMISQASKSLDITPRDKRDISTVTLSIAPEAVEKVKEMIKKFREDVVEEVSKYEATKAVYQFNLQLFPLAETPSSLDGEKKK